MSTLVHLLPLLMYPPPLLPSKQLPPTSVCTAAAQLPASDPRDGVGALSLAHSCAAGGMPPQRPFC
eukprot:1159022-Pelagomonas_calceolata.AAC.6